MLKYLTRLFDAWIPAQIKQRPDLHLKGQLMVQSFVLVMPLMAFYAIEYLLFGHYWGAAYAIYGFVGASFGVWDFRRRGNFIFSGNYFAFTSFVIVAAFTLTTYGFGTMIAPWIIMVPISAFLLVGIRSGIFWSLASVLLTVTLFWVELIDLPLPAYISKESIPYVNVTSLLGLISYIVFILLNNDLGKARLLKDLRKVKDDVEQKNDQITVINQDLEATVAKRTQGLLAANEELDTFLYESSHALRRPLVRIVGLLSLLEDELDPAEKAQFMNLISYTAHNMDAMLKDLMLVSEVYQKTLSPASVPLATEVDKLIEAHAGTDVKLSNQIPNDLRLSTDSDLLRIVLRKLMDNAVFYRRKETMHEVTVMAVRTAQGGCIVRIHDNGIGIDAGVVPQLFKMFARGTEQSRGSGLGLFIVGKAMERLGGKVWVESEKGVGTDVVIEF